MSIKQAQNAGDHSVNIQGESITVTTGLSYQDMRQVALDVFDQNFYRLAGVAAETGKARADEIIGKFLAELKLRNPDGVAAATDPDFQYSLFIAQREYARTGDEQLGDILVDLLVDRTKESKRSLISIVLNESLRVASQLTPEQYAVLGLVFTLRYTRYLKMEGIKALSSYVRDHILPFVPRLPQHEASILHLEFTGCSSFDLGFIPIYEVFSRTYPALFSTGFDPAEVIKLQEEDPKLKHLLCPCLRAKEKLQVNCLDEDTLKKRGAELGIESSRLETLLEIDRKHRLSGKELQETLDSIDPAVEALRGKWQSLQLGRMTLTSVGIAIGHANVRRITGETSPLGIWIK